MSKICICSKDDFLCQAWSSDKEHHLSQDRANTAHISYLRLVFAMSVSKHPFSVYYIVSLIIDNLIEAVYEGQSFATAHAFSNSEINRLNTSLTTLEKLSNISSSWQCYVIY